MKEITLKQYTIGEKRPKDGAICWVNPVDSFTQQLVFNNDYNCWDDAMGDDYYCGLDDGDVWIELPDL